MAGSPYYTEEHEAFRATMRRFVEAEIAPFADEWDEQREAGASNRARSPHV